MKALKITLYHTVLWAVWFALHSLSLIPMYAGLKPKDWTVIAYNYAAIVVVFYSIYCLMLHFFSRFSVARYNQLKWAQKISYLARYQLLAVLFITAVYIAVSVWVDTDYAGYKTPSVLFTAERRFTRIITYVLMATAYAYYINYKRRQQNLSRAQNERYKNLQKHTYTIKELYREITEAKSLN